MKLLFIPSGHPLMEADLCLMWEKLGIDWISTGYYSKSEKPGDLPYINSMKHKNLLTLLDKESKWTHDSDRPNHHCGQKNFQWTGQIINNCFSFSRKFLDNFDCVVATHFVDNIYNNINMMRNKRLFLYTYGMHEVADEQKIKFLKEKHGLTVIRNSPMEKLRPNSLAADDPVIRGCIVKDHEELSGWNGETNAVCTFASFINLPDKLCQTRRKYYTEIIKRTKKECHLFGINSGTFLKHEDKLNVLRNYRANLITGTPNANNTYSFVEAWVMGQPVVCFGPEMWQSKFAEPPTLIENGVNGFIGNTVDECVEYLNLLADDFELAKKIGAAGRASALQYYSRDILADKWKMLFVQNGLM